jgi:CcmD family protein
MDSNLEFLFAGFAVFWAGLFVYIVLLQMRLRSLQQDIETLEERLGEADADAAEQTGTTESKTSTS